jgi:hypothetical protein
LTRLLVKRIIRDILWCQGPAKRTQMSLPKWPVPQYKTVFSECNWDICKHRYAPWDLSFIPLSPWPPPRRSTPCPPFWMFDCYFGRNHDPTSSTLGTCIGDNCCKAALWLGSSISINSAYLYIHLLEVLHLLSR